MCSAMRDEYEDDPKKPRPLAPPKKGTNAAEAAEGDPSLIRNDEDRERHRHVV
jgi:hypothetical protein